MAAPDARRHDGPIAHPEHAMAFAIPHPARLLAGGLLLACGSAHAAVFVNELHYDNAGGDSGERIEIVATDGESLAGYRVHLYSGGSSPGSANTYGSATVPTGSVSSCGGSVRIATVAYSGLQNGSRSEEHTSELQSLMRSSYAVFCLNNKQRPLIHNEKA